jgi:hypothetical protein
MTKILKNVHVPFFILLIIQTFLSHEIFSCVIFAYILIYTFLKKIIYKKILPAIIAFIPLIVIGITNGIVFASPSTFWPILRDLYYMINGLSILYLGFIFYKENRNIVAYFNSLILASLFIGIFVTINFAIAINNYGLSSSINDFRSETKSSFIYCCTISLPIIIFYFSKIDYKSWKIIYVVSFLFSLSSFIVAMSRTNLLILLILVFNFFLFFDDSSLKNKLLVIVFFIFASYLITYFIDPNNVITSFLNKLLNSSKEISFLDNWTSFDNIQSNWRGYENYCALEQFNSSSFLEQIFGSGFGKDIFVGNAAFLVLGYGERGNINNSLAVLHNGYLTMLIKNGLLGLFVYISFYFSIGYISFSRLIKRRTFENILLFSLVVSLFIITYFLNGLFKDTYILSVILLIPVLLSYNGKEENLCLAN